MDYGRLNRKELQALCKEHGIPANKTNVYMAEALGALLNAHKESDQTEEPMSDPAEVVKSRATRGGSSKKGVDVLEAVEVDDLSSQLAKSTLGVVPSEEIMAESAAEDIREVELELMDTVVAPQETFAGKVPRTREIHTKVAPPKVPRRIRTATSKLPSRSQVSLDDDKPALVEPTLEVVLALPVDVEASETRFQSTYSRRAPNTKEQDTSEVAAPELIPAAPEDVVAPSEGDNNRTEEETVVEDTVPPANAATKKSKAKGKRSKVVKSKKPVSPISLPILEDAAAEIISGDASDIPYSPTLGLAEESISRETPEKAVSPSPAPEEEFVFQPVPSSFIEIMTPGKPPVDETKGCQHRIGRKNAKSCRSCASEKNVGDQARLLQEMLRAVNAPAPAEEVPQAEKTAVLTTPVKQSDNKENSLKTIDLECLSIRKLKQVQRTRKPFRVLV